MKKKLVPLAISASLFSVASYADNSGFYVEGQGGFLSSQRLNSTLFDLHSSKAKGKKGPAFAVRGGYSHPLSESFALGGEAGYFNLNKLRLDLPHSPTFTQDGVDALIVGKFNIINGFHVFAKGGLAFVNQEFKPSKDDGVISAKWRFHTMPEVAGGLGYSFNENVALTGTLSHLFDNSNQKASSNAAMLGLKVSF